MKSKTGYILLIAAGLFSISVMSAARSDRTPTEVAKESQAFDLSKIEPFEPASALQIHNFDMGYIEYGGIGFERSYTPVEFAEGKVNNKALPLCRKLWLINCQIALK